MILAIVIALSASWSANDASSECSRPDWRMIPMQVVQDCADRGDKPAQYEMGRRYELGIGVNRDFRAALRWYRRSARQQIHKSYTYSAPVGSEHYGRAIEYGERTIIPGYPPAIQRLYSLDKKSN